jgi:hypothetical protein
MGLAISVGIEPELADDEKELAEARAMFEGLSAALAAEGVIWTEPIGAPVPPSRAPALSFPYSWLHYLRRVYALVSIGRPVTPVDGPDERDRDNDAVEDETVMFSSHLLCHSDCEGYYVPVDFNEPLFLTEESGVAGGGMVGSSQGLRAELRRCAPAIGIRLTPDGSLPDAEAERLADLPEDASYFIESTVWLTLHEACEVSIASGHAIEFC